MLERCKNLMHLRRVARTKYSNFIECYGCKNGIKCKDTPAILNNFVVVMISDHSLIVYNKHENYAIVILDRTRKEYYVIINVIYSLLCI